MKPNAGETSKTINWIFWGEYEINYYISQITH